MIEGYITITFIITFIITSSLVKLFVCNVKKTATDDDVIWLWFINSSDMNGASDSNINISCSDQETKVQLWVVADVCMSGLHHSTSLIPISIRGGMLSVRGQSGVLRVTHSSGITSFEHFSLCCCWCLLSLLFSPFLLQLHHLLPSHFIALSSLHLPPLFHCHAPFLLLGKSVHGQDGPYGTLNYTQVPSNGEKSVRWMHTHTLVHTDRLPVPR